MKNNHCYYSRSAFTLVEMMVSVTLFLVVLTLAFNTLLAATAIRRTVAARIDINQNTRAIFQVMIRELSSIHLRSERDDVLTPPERLRIDSGYLPPTNNGRGRFQLIDWPPPKEFASNFGLSPDNRQIFSGNGIDDDGDGRTDEEAYDGLDNDNDGENGSPVYPNVDPRYAGKKMADGIDNNGDGLVDEGIDEDIFYPRDMVNFTAIINTGKVSDLVEIGYSIYPLTGKHLLRRYAAPDWSLNRNTNDPFPQVDGIYSIGMLYNGRLNGESYGRFVPYPTDSINTSDNVLTPWFYFGPEPQNVNQNTLYPTSYGLSFDVNSEQLLNEVPQDSIDQNIDIFAANVVGFDCKAYYHDWFIHFENKNNSPKDKKYNPYSFPRFFWDSSVEFISNNPFFQSSTVGMFPNEPDDLEGFAKGDRKKILNKTDGLPLILEISLFVRDQNQYKEEPVEFKTRVYLEANE